MRSGGCGAGGGAGGSGKSDRILGFSMLEHFTVQNRSNKSEQISFEFFSAASTMGGGFVSLKKK